MKKQKLKERLKERLKEIDNKLEECIEDVFLTRGIIQDLFQIIEELSDENFVLQELNVKLNDEINILKGEHPNPKPKKKKNKNISYRKEKKDAEDEILEKNSEKKETKIDKIEISEEQICFLDRSTLPEDAEFKGYTNVIVQEIELKPKNIIFKKEIFYSNSEKKTYIADLPEGFDGEFGPELKALIINLKHSSNVSEPKIHSLLEDIGISIGKATISRILTQNNEEFHEEKQKIVNAGFNSSSFQQIDDTGAKVNGQKHFTQVICNPLYTAYFTLPNKERLSIIELLNGKEIERYYKRSTILFVL